MLNPNNRFLGDAQLSQLATRCAGEPVAAAYAFEQSLLPAGEMVVDCAVVGVPSSGKFSTAAADVNRATGGFLSRLIDQGTFSGETAATVYLPLVGIDNVSGVLAVGTGPTNMVEPAEFGQIVEAVHDGLLAYRIRSAALFLSGIEVQARDERWKVRQQAIGFETAAFRYDATHHKSDVSLGKVILAVAHDQAEALSEGIAIADGICTAGSLGDAPPNICTPTFLADFSLSLANQVEGLSAHIVDEDEMAELGMNTMLSVGQGSAQPSKFIVMNYSHPDHNADAPVVLIGKGVTFDTGGTALKTREAMGQMKYDMCGAAAVIAAIKAAAMLKLPMNIVGLCACAENMPGSSATRPSDTVTSMSGKTIEILNPDAEGRLLLCDALSYAERYNPDVVIDVATLTGASVVALGRHYSALFANDQALCQELLDAGDMAMDKAWQLPLSKEDLSQLDSRFADLANMGDGTAGCVVAALFLSHFAGSFRWAHLDISGTAKSRGDKLAATGRPVGLLIQFLLNRCSGSLN